MESGTAQAQRSESKTWQQSAQRLGTIHGPSKSRAESAQRTVDSIIVASGESPVTDWLQAKANELKSKGL